MSETFNTRYAALIDAGKIEADPGQAVLAKHLVDLDHRLDQHRLAAKSSSLGWLFGNRAKASGPLKGLYLYGEVGRGKTMLMDLFFETNAVTRKRRVHFHEFMADVHERVHAYRQELKNGEVAEQDPIHRAAKAIAEESWLLCFDEFHVTDPRPPVHAAVRTGRRDGGNVKSAAGRSLYGWSQSRAVSAVHRPA
jgi:cell division protein ZapE